MIYKKNRIINFLNENKKMLFALFILGILEDIYLREASSNLITFGAIAVYVTFVTILKLKSSFTVLLCIILIFTMSINYIFLDTSISTEKAAVWFILFFIIGVIQRWIE